MFRRSPAFAGFCVLILALGIGSVVAIFGVVNALLLRPLPYPHGDQIVRVMNKVPKLGLRNNVSGPNWQDWHDRSKSFAALATFRGGEVGITVNGRGSFHEVYYVSREFLDVFEVEPAVGVRMDTSSVVISHGFWQQHFGGLPAALGQKLKLDDQIYTIAGVMPQAFQYPNKAAVWVLDPTSPAKTHRTANNYRSVGRLHTGIEAAQAEMDAIAEGLGRQYPESNRQLGVGLIGLQEQAAASYRATLLLLFGGSVLLLLIACANVSSVVLARAQARQREFAVRASLGASSGRIVLQVVGEGLALGLAGGFAGVLLAQWALSALGGTFDAPVDWRVALFATGVGVASSLLFSIYPAWKVSRVDLTATLRGAGQKGTIGGGGWFRRGLAMAQVALSLAMLCGALMLVRSMERLLHVDMGIDPRNVLVSYTHVPAKDLDGHLKAADAFGEMLRELRQSPQVVAAAAIMGMPTGKYGSNGAYTIAGQPMPKDLNQLPQAGFRVNSPGFFATMRIPLLQGRDFTDGDRYDKPFVAIINQTLAKQSFPGESPLGKQILCGLDSPKPMTIVGVVGDVRHGGPASEPTAELYMPYHQHPFYANELQVAVRSSGDPKPLSSLVREIASRTNPDVAVHSITLESMLEDNLATHRLRMQVLSALAVLALLLASAGLYGVLAYLVSQRLPEFGLRVALGASALDVARLVWREAALILAVGFAAGLALVVALSASLKGFLYGIEPSDPASIGLALGVLGLVAIVASLVPARGAIQADPLTVLRSE